MELRGLLEEATQATRTRRPAFPLNSRPDSSLTRTLEIIVGPDVPDPVDVATGGFDETLFAG